jgi:hypothetical protein
MSGELIPILAKAASSEGLLKAIYGDLAKPGVSQVGKALGTIIGLGSTALWPIQLLNERARIALEDNLERYRQKLESIPNVNIVSPPVEVGVPVMEKLSYIEDADLRELYTTLLAKASNVDTQSKAHPSFVNIINNLSPDEAQLLKQFSDQPSVPFAVAKFINPRKNEWHTLADLHFILRKDINLTFPENLHAYVSNLEGLGLLSVRHDIFIARDDLYEPLVAQLTEEFKDIERPPEYSIFRCDRGRIDITEFGELFIGACVRS